MALANASRRSSGRLCIPWLAVLGPVVRAIVPDSWYMRYLRYWNHGGITSSDPACLPWSSDACPRPSVRYSTPRRHPGRSGGRAIRIMTATTPRTTPSTNRSRAETMKSSRSARASTSARRSVWRSVWLDANAPANRHCIARRGRSRPVTYRRAERSLEFVLSRFVRGMRIPAST